MRGDFYRYTIVNRPYVEIALNECLGLGDPYLTLVQRHSSYMGSQDAASGGM